jgi:hypothetical protein
MNVSSASINYGTEAIGTSLGWKCMTFLGWILLVIVLLAAEPSRAQHCGFDFSSIIIIKLEPSGLTQVKSIEAILPDDGKFRFWKNVLPKDGSLPKIIHRPSILDSHSYWFADSNYAPDRSVTRSTFRSF